FKSLGTPEVAARSISQVFLGVRIECAECHHHPSEKWGQDDYWALAGMFSGVARKPLPGGAEAVGGKGGAGLGPKGGGRKKRRGGGTTGARARPLGARAPKFAPPAAGRRVLADGMPAPDTPYFAAAIATRLWAHYFGRELVEPIDDIRATNPASNEPLLAALTA